MTLEEVHNIPHSGADKILFVIEVHMSPTRDDDFLDIFLASTIFAAPAEDFVKLLRMPSALCLFTDDNKNRLRQIQVGKQPRVKVHHQRHGAQEHLVLRVLVLCTGCAVVLVRIGEVDGSILVRLGRDVWRRRSFAAFSATATAIAASLCLGLGFGLQDLRNLFEVREVLRGVVLAVPAVARAVTDVYCADGGDGLEAVVPFGCGGGVASACADSNDGDALCVHAVEALEVVEHGGGIGDALGRVFKEMWETFGLALVRGVVAYRDEARAQTGAARRC